MMSTATGRATNAARRLIAGLAMCLMSTAWAGHIQQSFSSEWYVAPWDYYGDFAAMQWHYVPYAPWDPAVGRLLEIHVTTRATGTRADPSDAVKIRYAFFTGWAPNDYQFYDAVVVAAGDSGFDLVRSFDFTNDSDVANWAFPDYLPQANYYFESRTVAAAHSISATTTLDFIYAEAPEPGSVYLAVLPLLILLLSRSGGLVPSWRSAETISGFNANSSIKRTSTASSAAMTTRT